LWDARDNFLFNLWLQAHIPIFSFFRFFDLLKALLGTEIFSRVRVEAIRLAANSSALLILAENAVLKQEKFHAFLTAEISIARELTLDRFVCYHGVTLVASDSLHSVGLRFCRS
jgi:hypothetical protein